MHTYHRQKALPKELDNEKKILKSSNRKKIFHDNEKRLKKSGSNSNYFLSITPVKEKQYHPCKISRIVYS